MKWIYILFCATIISCNSTPNKTTGNADQIIDIDITKAKELISKGAIPLDIRTPGEVEKGKITNALVIDYKNSDFESKVALLDKDKTYVVYCKSGGRSSRSMSTFAKHGFKSYYNLEGGYNAWIK